jgi:hypothetical protein
VQALVDQHVGLGNWIEAGMSMRYDLDTLEWKVPLITLTTLINNPHNPNNPNSPKNPNAPNNP